MFSIIELITIIGVIWSVFSVGFTLGRAYEKYRHEKSRQRSR